MQPANAIAILLIAGMIACTDKKEGDVIAEAYGAKLYASDISELINKGTSTEDSVFIVKEYINSWVAQQVILHMAGSVLSEEEKDKSRELENYKNDLLVYETLNKLASQRVDSNFTEEELQGYYEANKEEFELTENIVKIMFFRIPSDAEELDELWIGFNQDDEEAIEALLKLAREKGNFYSDTSSWLFFDDILKEIPINTYNQEHFLNNNKYIRIVEGSFVYFVKIHDFRIKSGTSPFDLEKERIKKILFILRQQETLNKVETDLIQNAYNSNQIIIH